ncbi:MAG: hypothetical protein HKO65_08575 [Gemmatimonadetes bacterium]|nr:hypothetical protein [Gemmatimonadota bacterium]
MRRSTPLGLLAIMLLFLAPGLEAQDVTGTWTLTYSAPGRAGEAMERSMEFTFQQEGTTVTGTTEFARMGRRPGGGGGRNVPAPDPIQIKDGMMEDGKLTFTVSRAMGQQAISMVFVGTVSGTTMEGTVTTSGGRRGGGEVPFKGVKKEG